MNKKVQQRNRNHQTEILEMKNTVTKDFNRELQNQTWPCRRRIRDLEDRTVEFIQSE